MFTSDPLARNRADRNPRDRRGPIVRDAIPPGYLDINNMRIMRYLYLDCLTYVNFFDMPDDIVPGKSSPWQYRNMTANFLG